MARPNGSLDSFELTALGASIAAQVAAVLPPPATGTAASAAASPLATGRLGRPYADPDRAAPAASRCGSLPSSIVATISPVAGSSRVTVRSRLEATQTPPSPTATSTGPSPTGKAGKSVVRVGAPLSVNRIRVTVSSSKLVTHRASGPTAIALGACPTLSSGNASFVGGSTSTIAFAARSTSQNEPSPKAASEYSGACSWPLAAADARPLRG